jgi:nucleoside-diphosphate-sugar epimerase
MSTEPIDTIADVADLEDRLSRPPPALIEAMSRLQGDLLVLGAAGKMGPTLARMARRAFDQADLPRRVIGVSRFSEPGLQDRLESWGVQTIAADLLDPAQVAQLPDIANVVFMAGMKFGSTGNEALTWAMNVHLPALVAQKFPRSRIVAFGTGNVYGLSPISLGGSLESDPLNPTGEYAMSCVGRERMFEHFSRVNGTKMSLIRLNYACELRYGVLVDLARKVWEGRSVDLAMGAFNAIWQADANAAALRSFEDASSPPLILNLAGPETLSVRRVCQQFGELFGKPAAFEGCESPDALLSNGQRVHTAYGYPEVPVGRLIRWVADWVSGGGTLSNKPTHFEARDGRF